MKVELQRLDLIRLCCWIASENTGDIKTHKFKDAFERRPFINGDLYRLKEDWINEASDEKLFEFYQYHSSTIKLL